MGEVYLTILKYKEEHVYNSQYEMKSALSAHTSNQSDIPVTSFFKMYLKGGVTEKQGREPGKVRPGGGKERETEFFFCFFTPKVVRGLDWAWWKAGYRRLIHSSHQRVSS